MQSVLSLSITSLTLTRILEHCGLLLRERRSRRRGGSREEGGKRRMEEEEGGMQTKADLFSSPLLFEKKRKRISKSTSMLYCFIVFYWSRI